MARRGWRLPPVPSRLPGRRGLEAFVPFHLPLSLLESHPSEAVAVPTPVPEPGRAPGPCASATFP